MAKAPWILEGARGKVGNLVARKSEGGTTVAQYKVPANPRTNGQMRTRVAFGTVAKAGAALADLVGISFQGQTSIKGARRWFNALNISRMAQALKTNIAEGRFAPKGFSVLIPNKYVVSDGTIRNATLGTPQVIGSGISQTSQKFTLQPGIRYTPAEIIKAAFGVETGDQITLVGIKSGLPVNYYPDDLQILRDGQMVSARVVMNTDANLQAASSSYDVVVPEGSEEGAASTLKNAIADAVEMAIDDLQSYTPFETVFANPDLYECTYNSNTRLWEILLDFESASGDVGGAPLSILGNRDEIMAYGYFRSHLNNAGTQWMFSRCQLVCIQPEYTQETYDGEEPINYGCDYTLALSSYMPNSVRENVRYTETGGPDNTLGF